MAFIPKEEYRFKRELNKGLLKKYPILDRKTFKQTKFTTKEQSNRAGRAISGILGALVPSESLAGSVSFSKTKGESRQGRGRPSGTYKPRYIPGYGVVRLPTSQYRKIMSDIKKQRRLALTKKKADIQALQRKRSEERQLAEQIATSQDPRFRSDSDDSFLEEPDYEYEQRLAEQRQLEQIRRQRESQRVPIQRNVLSNIGRQLVRGASQLANSPMLVARRQPSLLSQQNNQYSPQGYNPYIDTPQRDANIRIISDKSSILNAPNIFNKPRY